MKYTLLKITTSVVCIAIVAGLFFFGDRLSPDDGKSGAGQEETYKDAFRFDPEELSYDGTGELDLLDGVTLEGYTARELEGMVFTRIRAGDSLSEKKVQYTAETEGGKVRSFRPLRLRNYSGPKIRIPNSLPEVTRNLAGNFGKLLMVKDGYVVDDGFGNDVRQYAEIVYEADDRESARIHYTISFENMFGDRDVAKVDVILTGVPAYLTLTDSEIVLPVRGEFDPAAYIESAVYADGSDAMAEVLCSGNVDTSKAGTYEVVYDLEGEMLVLTVVVS